MIDGMKDECRDKQGVSARLQWPFGSGPRRLYQGSRSLNHKMVRNKDPIQRHRRMRSIQAGASTGCPARISNSHVFHKKAVPSLGKAQRHCKNERFRYCRNASVLVQCFRSSLPLKETQWKYLFSKKCIEDAKRTCIKKCLLMVSTSNASVPTAPIQGCCIVSDPRKLT